MSYFLTLLLCFVIIFQPGVFFPALTPFRPLMIVAAAALLAWLLSPRQSAAFKSRSPLGHFIIGLVAAQSFSVLQYLYIPILLEVTLMWVNFALVYFLVSAQINQEKQVRAVWIAVLSGTAWLILHAIWVYHTQPPTHPQLLGGRLSSYGAYAGANDLALLIVCAWPIVFKFTDLIENRFLKFLPIPFLLAMVYADLRTLSRGGLMGLVLVMGLSMWRGRSLGHLGRWALVLPLAIAIMMVGSKLLLTRSDVQDFSGQDESMQNRIEAWSAGFAMLKAKPLYGVGSGYFAEYSDEFGTDNPIQAHNTIVKVAAETGLPGLICYLGMLITAFRSLWRSWRRFSKIKPDGPEVLWAEALGIALIGFFFNTQFSVKAHEWLLYLIMASAISLEKIYLREAIKFALSMEELERQAARSGTTPA